MPDVRTEARLLPTQRRHQLGHELLERCREFSQVMQGQEERDPWGQLHERRLRHTLEALVQSCVLQQKHLPHRCHVEAVIRQRVPARAIHCLGPGLSPEMKVIGHCSSRLRGTVGSINRSFHGEQPERPELLSA
jgi:hypothetical protein